MMKRPHAICRRPHVHHYLASPLHCVVCTRMRTQRSLADSAKDVESHLVAHVPCISSLSSPPVQGMSQRAPN
eukprot:COSAG03_NODE_7159_length_956_cov_1.743291_1_plen_72_part_00